MQAMTYPNGVLPFGPPNGNVTIVPTFSANGFIAPILFVFGITI
jgi:hypothetical protein